VIDDRPFELGEILWVVGFVLSLLPVVEAFGFSASWDAVYLMPHCAAAHDVVVAVLVMCVEIRGKHYVIWRT
jgi:hypothetical protein